ncbi:lipopolysaccharide biosynthesis protein [Geodermatophilus sp. SYSU D01180]
MTGAPGAPGASLRRAVLFTSASSALVPLAGLLTQPVLARALGATGRGEMAAAIVPAVLAGSVATLGLPDALTYLAAKRPWTVRRALAWSALLSVAMGVLCFFLAWALLPFLSDGDAALGRLMLLAMALSIPMLIVGALRGAAMGHQMWGAVALESIVTTSLRVLVFVGLWLTGDLTPLIGVMVTFLAPAVAGLCYWPLLRKPPGMAAEPVYGDAERVLVPLVSYGGRTWFGSVASMLAATIHQILMTPLASVRDLGLYSVAATVMDVPIIFSRAVAGALHGVNSKTSNAVQVATACRVTTLLGLVGCVVLGLSAPLWMVPLFGESFADAVLPTQLLLISVVCYIPGPLAGAGLASFGRPGLRSLGFGLTLLINIAVFVVLVPRFGILGACLTGIVASALQSLFLVVAASRVLGVPAHRFVVPGPGDVALVWRESLRVLETLLAPLRGRLTGGKTAGRD